MPAAKLWTGSGWAYEVPVSDITEITLNANGTDQTASLITQIAAVPDGTGIADTNIIRLPAGSFRVDGTIAITGRSWLSFEGPTTGGRFESYAGAAGAYDRAHWRFSGCSNVSLRHVDIIGTCSGRAVDDDRFGLYQEAWYGQHGLAITGACNNMTCEDIGITNVYGDFIYLGGTGDQSTDLTIRDVVGRYAGRQALGIVNVDRCLIEDIDLQWNGRSGMDIEPNHDSHYIKFLTMRRCTIGSKFYPFIIGGDAGDALQHVNDIVLEDCTGLNATSSHTALLASARCTNITVRRHTDLRQRTTQCMSFGFTAGTLIVEDCIVQSGPSTPTSYGAYLGAVTAAVELRRNNFSGTGAASTGADQLYFASGAEASIVHCGNVWAGNTLNDGAC